MRTRLTVQQTPLALLLVDTPNPECRNCNGTGDMSANYTGPAEYHPGILDCRCWEPGWGWQVLPLPRRIGNPDRRPSRLRLRIADHMTPYVAYRGRTLVLTDTPRPDCANCHGQGGWDEEFGDPVTGEYPETEWITCHCWHHRHTWPVLRLPRRRSSEGFSDEPPF